LWTWLLHFFGYLKVFEIVNIFALQVKILFNKMSVQFIGHHRFVGKCFSTYDALGNRFIFWITPCETNGYIRFIVQPTLTFTMFWRPSSWWWIPTYFQSPGSWWWVFNLFWRSRSLWLAFNQFRGLSNKSIHTYSKIIFNNNIFDFSQINYYYLHSLMKTTTLSRLSIIKILKNWYCI